MRFLRAVFGLLRLVLRHVLGLVLRLVLRHVLGTGLETGPEISLRLSNILSQTAV